MSRSRHHLFMAFLAVACIGCFWGCPASAQAQTTAMNGVGVKPKATLSATANPGTNRITYAINILGAGDRLEIKLLDQPELSGSFEIGPDGTLYLPHLRALYVEGLTIEELRYFLNQQFKPYVRNPQVYVRPMGYRPISIYAGGEIPRSGFDTLRGVQKLSESETQAGSSVDITLGPTGLRRGTSTRNFTIIASSSSAALLPTVFDGIGAAQGVTPCTDIASVRLTRCQPISAGGGRIQTEFNFLSLITEGDKSQNIRLFDGDVITVAKNPIVLREQLLKASQANLKPKFTRVYFNDRLHAHGNITMSQGSSLSQAL